MKRIGKTALRAAVLLVAGLCAAGALVPLAVYGIFHVGCWGLLIYGVLLAALALWWNRIPRGAGRMLRNLLALLLAAGTLLAAGLSVPMLRYGLSAPEDPAGRTVVVLGCQVQGETPSLMLSRRILRAAELLTADAALPVVASGGQGPGEAITEAEAIARVLQEHGIASERIYLEPNSHSTEQNMAFSAEVITEQGLPRQLAIVTDEFHQFRAHLYAEKAGMPDTIAFSSRTPAALLPGYWARELFAVAKALLC